MSLLHVTDVLAANQLVDTQWFTEESRDRGTALHWGINLINKGMELEPDSIDPIIQNRLAAYLKWQREMKPVVRASEVYMENESLGLCGTADIIALMPDGDTTIDVKSGPPGPAQYQLAGYALLYGKPVRRAALQLSDDGNYRWHAYTDRRDVRRFAAMLTVAHMKLEDGIWMPHSRS